jgi:hypothetical protein
LLTQFEVVDDESQRFDVVADALAIGEVGVAAG